MTKIVCISDTHTQHDNIIIPECDILIHAGDFCGWGEYDEVEDFTQWFAKQTQARHRIMIAGNHDTSLDVRHPNYDRRSVDLVKNGNFIYLQDEAVKIDGLLIYGSPWIPTIGHWAFMGLEGSRLPVRDEPLLSDVFSKIPHGVDILVTHSPPCRISGMCNDLGSYALTKEILQKRPRLSVSGHIHWHGGKTSEYEGIKFVNACICDHIYDPTNHPVIIEL